MGSLFLATKGIISNNLSLSRATSGVLYIFSAPGDVSFVPFFIVEEQTLRQPVSLLSSQRTRSIVATEVILNAYGPEDELIHTSSQLINTEKPRLSKQATPLIFDVAEVKLGNPQEAKVVNTDEVELSNSPKTED